MAERGAVQRIADAAEVNQKTVRRVLAEAGLDANTVDFDEAVRLVKANADPARIAGHASNGRGEGGGSATQTLADARARAELARARKVELEVRQAEGELVEREAVVNTITAIVATARTQCLALGVRCAPRLVGQTDRSQIAKIIEAEMRRILEGLADDTAFFTKLDDDALL